MNIGITPIEADHYRICVRGVLDPRWSDWFDDFAITQVDGDSLLTGSVRDQAAFSGAINKIDGLGLCLLLVERFGNKE